MDVPLSVVQARDPKGLYKKAADGEIKGFTGVDDPYEPPLHPEISLPNQDMTVDECVSAILKFLRSEGVLVGGPTLKKGLPFPDGDRVIDLHVTSEARRDALKDLAKRLPKVLLSDIDINWLQTIAEGWAAPLTGFMRVNTYILLPTFGFGLYNSINCAVLLGGDTVADFTL